MTDSTTGTKARWSFRFGAFVAVANVALLLFVLGTDTTGDGELLVQSGFGVVGGVLLMVVSRNR